MNGVRSLVQWHPSTALDRRQEWSAVKLQRGWRHLSAAWPERRICAAGDPGA